MRKEADRTDCFVLGNGARGRAFYEALAVEGKRYTDLSAWDGNPPAVKGYIVLEEDAGHRLPEVMMKLSQAACYDIFLACSSRCGFDYYRGERVEVNGTAFIRLTFRAMSPAGLFVKRLFDVSFCSLGLLVLSPLFLLSSVLVKCSSRGPVFYSQERIGKNGKPFRIYKFRSMKTDAEAEGPRLSSKGDARITPWGEIMRKFRIDELPQLWNVVKGDMALVGYRPERAFYIERIVRFSPYYRLLGAVKPGITSLGITTLGYAENVEQMLVRLEKDMEYLRRLSLKEDIRIIGKTVKVVFYGRGK